MIAVFGAGAIGCWVGGKLAGGGAKVTLIGRPRVLDELANGLTATELDDGRDSEMRGAIVPRAAFTATPDPAAAAGADIVLVTVKSAQTAEAGAELARVVSERAVVISLQNGVRNSETLRAALPGRTVLAGMVPWNVTRQGPGHYHRGTSGTLMIEQHARATAFADACRAAHLPVELRGDMRAVLWAKLVLNLNNAVNALSGLPLASELAQRAYRRVLAASQREALRVLAAANQPIAKLTLVPPRLMPRVLELPDRVFTILARKTIAIDPHARSSMWDDLEAKRPTEIDYLQGEVVALAQRLGKAAPVNAKLVELVRSAETGGRRDFSGDELAARIPRTPDRKAWLGGVP
ncbi:MAG: 2-dehydropantoate 2-reductase [Kofleriaceae bacterium]|nr:2-dehydropantoate 2-reductase [Kofleriaceae bacterium]